ETERADLAGARPHLLEIVRLEAHPPPPPPNQRGIDVGELIKLGVGQDVVTDRGLGAERGEGGEPQSRLAYPAGRLGPAADPHPQPDASRVTMLQLGREDESDAELLQLPGTVVDQLRDV